MPAVTRDQTPIPPVIQERGLSPSSRVQQATPPAIQERGGEPYNPSPPPPVEPIIGGVNIGRFNQGLDTP